MALGKYYCDYCEKQFQDTASARKRHLQSSQHQRNRSLYYDSITHSSSPPPCHRFLRTGFCPYGDGCKYSHPTPPQHLLGPSSGGMAQVPIFPGNQHLGTPSRGETVKDHSGVSWGNLPPSLRPPPEGGYPSLPFVDWG